MALRATSRIITKIFNLSILNKRKNKKKTAVMQHLQKISLDIELLLPVKGNVQMLIGQGRDASTTGGTGQKA